MEGNNAQDHSNC